MCSRQNCQGFAQSYQGDLLLKLIETLTFSVIKAKMVRRFSFHLNLLSYQKLEPMKNLTDV